MASPEKKRIPVSEAIALCIGILVERGIREDYALMVAEHLVDAALAGHPFAGLPRVLAIVSQLQGRSPATPVRILNETENSAQIDGGDNLGYVVSTIAIDKAVELARRSGIGMVGVNNTWYSGRLAYYVERAAKQGFVAIHTTSAQARVAPYAGIDPILGTNPLSMGFPCDPEPIVIDIGTSMATEGEVMRRQALNVELPSGWAIDPDGAPTIDAKTVWEGALLPWGGARGYSIALAVQLLGILSGGKAVVETPSDVGQFFLVVDPERLMPLADFKTRASKLAETIRESRPSMGSDSVRMPGDRSQQSRRVEDARGEIEVDAGIYQQLIALTNN